MVGKGMGEKDTLGRREGDKERTRTHTHTHTHGIIITQDMWRGGGGGVYGKGYLLNKFKSN